jgi:hypothetical protein
MRVPVCTEIVCEMTVINATWMGIIEVASARMKPVGVCTVENYTQKLISKLYQL